MESRIVRIRCDPTSSKELSVLSSGVFTNSFEQGENMEMVKWIGKFSLLLKRLRDAWMDMLPMFAMSETRKQNQYLVDDCHTVLNP